MNYGEFESAGALILPNNLGASVHLVVLEFELQMG